jgi:exodeoxyribonuclease-3
MRWEVTDPPLPPRAPPLASDVPALRVVSWNVNGIRALLQKDPDVLDRVAREENADVFVLQETKIQAKQVDEIDARVLAEYPHRIWNCSTARLGYSGTALFSREAPLNAWTDPFVATEKRSSRQTSSDEKNECAFKHEGRVVVAEFPRVFVVGAYVPNSGAELARLGARTNAWDPSAARYLRALEAKKPVVYCGDLNVAARDVDVWGNHRANAKSAGFTKEEREAFARHYVGLGGGVENVENVVLDEENVENDSNARRDSSSQSPLPFVDTFRKTHPNASAYSWFSYRGGARNKNRGWRIDYVLASDTPELVVHDAYIRGDVGGSDHVPVGVVLRLTGEGGGRNA